MNVHSARNNLDDTCQVQVEDIANMSDTTVALFAMGAAGLRNPGYTIRGGDVTAYLDDNLATIPAGDDTVAAFAAIVSCSLGDQS